MALVVQAVTDARHGFEQAVISQLFAQQVNTTCQALVGRVAPVPRLPHEGFATDHFTALTHQAQQHIANLGLHVFRFAGHHDLI